MNSRKYSNLECPKGIGFQEFAFKILSPSQSHSLVNIHAILSMGRASKSFRQSPVCFFSSLVRFSNHCHNLCRYWLIGR